MKRVASVLLMAVLLLGLIFSGGCFRKEATTTKEAVTYQVGVSGTSAPFGFIGKDGNVRGFDIDIMNAIAEAEGVKFKYGITNRAAKIPALKAGQFDILISAMTITDERKKEVDFSDPYFESTIYLLVPLDSKIKSLNDLKGRTVACAMATTSDIALTRFLGKNSEGIKRFKHTTTAFMEVRNLKVDAAAGDSAIVKEYLRNNPELKLKIVRDNRFPKEYYGIAVRKGDVETLRIINRGLEKIKINGRYEAAYKKWIQD